MQRTTAIALALLAGLWIALMAACSPEGRDDRRDKTTAPEQPKRPLSLAFNGGPPGGTFNFLANKMSCLITDHVAWMAMMPRESGGSLSNICALNTNRADMAILYAGDAFLGRNGKLECPDGRLDRIRSMAYLYGAPAQLIVRRDSGIKSVHDLKGRIVAVGNTGSGAALSAKRFFNRIGMWKDIDHRNLGYSEAATEFGAGRVDAFWVLAGYPNSSVIEASAMTPIRLIDLHTACLFAGFYELYPFYVHAEIPAGTYEGQADPVQTFQDSALWCARKDLDEAAVYHGLKAIFSEKGLKGMREAHRSARSMSEEQALDNLSVPLHPGAVRFWSEKGKSIPAILLP